MNDLTSVESGNEKCPSCPFGECFAQDETMVMLSPGALLYREGEWNDDVYCLRKGRVAVSRRDSSGTLRIVAVGEPGEILGTDSLRVRAPRTSVAFTLRSSLLCVIPRLSFVEFLSTNWDAASRILRKMCHRLDRMESYTTQSKEHGDDSFNYEGNGVGGPGKPAS